MPVSALLLGASAAVRAASLNLCTDEYLLLLGRPDEIVGVSYLSRQKRESSLWKRARFYPGNAGSIEDVLTLRPTLLLTMGGGGRATPLLAERMRLRALDLPMTGTPEQVGRNLRTVAAALGDTHRADPWLSRLDALRQTSPRLAKDAIWVSGAGLSFAPGSPGAEWLRLAGLQQRPLPGGRVTLETLLTVPPKVLVQSDYRSGQVSAGARWLENPIVRHARSRRILADGRSWTCLGALMIPEIERLRRVMK